MTTPAAIEFKDGEVRFRHAGGRRVVALENINLAVDEGQFVCVVGRSGGGKSTLVRAVAGLTRLTAGAVLVAAAPVTGPGADRAMVFQEDTVFPWLRVRENVEFGLRAKGLSKTECVERARRWLDAVGLAEFEGSWPRELSGGMRKRVALATVFATGARILLMDEPFGALDFVTRAILHDVLLDLWAQTRNTILFVTHDIEEALVLGDRILVVSGGRVLDDLSCDLPRPRVEDVRTSASAVSLAKTIIRRLGLEGASASRNAT